MVSEPSEPTEQRRKRGWKRVPRCWLHSLTALGQICLSEFPFGNMGVVSSDPQNGGYFLLVSLRHKKGYPENNHEPHPFFREPCEALKMVWFLYIEVSRTPTNKLRHARPRWNPLRFLRLRNARGILTAPCSNLTPKLPRTPRHPKHCPQIPHQKFHF